MLMPMLPAGAFVAETGAPADPLDVNSDALIAVGAAFEEGESVVHIVGVDEAEHGAEDFCVRRDRWLLERCSKIVGFTKLPDSYFAIFELRPSSRTFAPCLSPSAMSDSTRSLLCGVSRDHLYTFFKTVADFKFRGGVRRWNRGKFFLRFADCYRDRDGEATLAGAAECTVH